MASKWVAYVLLYVWRGRGRCLQDTCTLPMSSDKVFRSNIALQLQFALLLD